MFAPSTLYLVNARILALIPSNMQPILFASGTLVADAGCILESLGDYIAPHNHIIPLDLGAKGR